LEAMIVTEKKDKKDMSEQEDLQEPDETARITALEEQMSQLTEKVQAIFDTVMGEAGGEEEGAPEGAPPEEMEADDEKASKDQDAGEDEEGNSEDSEEDPSKDAGEEEAGDDNAAGDDAACGPKKPKRDISQMSRGEIEEYLAKLQGGKASGKTDPRKPETLAQAGISTGKDDSPMEPTKEEISKAVDEYGLEAVLEDLDTKKE